MKEREADQRQSAGGQRDGGDRPINEMVDAVCSPSRRVEYDDSRTCQKRGDERMAGRTGEAETPRPFTDA